MTTHNPTDMTKPNANAGWERTYTRITYARITHTRSTAVIERVRDPAIRSVACPNRPTRNVSRQRLYESRDNSTITRVQRMLAAPFSRLQHAMYQPAVAVGGSWQLVGGCE